MVDKALKIVYPYIYKNMDSMPDLDRIKELYAQSKVARGLFADFARRKRNQTESTVETLLVIAQKELKLLGERDAGATRQDVIDFLKRLEELGLGEFVAGRKGRPSRFVWRVGVGSLGRVVMGEAVELQALPSAVRDNDAPPVEVPEIPADTMRVAYPLRPDLNVEIAPLPKNMTAKEAQRLADFIKTLPFEDTSSHPQGGSDTQQKAPANGSR